MAVDSQGFRPNVGVVVRNKKGQVLWAKRKGQNSWQFPQGGIDEGETEKEAMYRELYEEVGLKEEHVKIITISKHWLRYKLPYKYIKNDKNRGNPAFVGQKQKWFFLELKSDDSVINLNVMNKAEFDSWKWVSFWYPLRYIISFKKDVYRKVLKEFSVFNTISNENKE